VISIGPPSFRNKSEESKFNLIEEFTAIYISHNEKRTTQFHELIDPQKTVLIGVGPGDNIFRYGIADSFTRFEHIVLIGVGPAK
jgi:hypothetical protein